MTEIIKTLDGDQEPKESYRIRYDRCIRNSTIADPDERHTNCRDLAQGGGG